jgi:hypothetical protein
MSSGRPTIVNEWAALERAGEWAGLEGAALDEYVVLVADIYNAGMADYGEFENYEEEYYQFLNDRVFSDDRVIDLLRSMDVDDETVQTFQAGRVPVAETYRTERMLDHGLDELVDLIVMLRLVKRYTTVANQEYLESRYRFQKLLFATNLDLKETQTGSIVDESELGLLETTGYRYSFTKRSSGPFSKDAYIDKDRLYANGLIEEDVVADEGTGEVAEHEHTYGIKLSLNGELLLNRFSDMLSSFNSDILFYWNQSQEKAIEASVGRTREEIGEYIAERADVKERETGATLLPPRQARFDDSDEDEAGGIAEVITNA